VECDKVEEDGKGGDVTPNFKGKRIRETRMRLRRKGEEGDQEEKDKKETQTIFAGHSYGKGSR